MAKYQKYAEYKDSGVEWLGGIPSHWDLQRLKVILNERNEKNDPIKSTNILSLTMHQGVIPYSEKEGSGGNKPKEDLTAYKLVYENDIVLNSMNVIVGSVGISKYFGIASLVYYMLYPRSLNQTNIRFYNYIFQAKSFQENLGRLGTGILIKKSESSGKLNTIRMKISMEDLNNEILTIPSVEEQTQIANFLDHETAQIDTLIAKQEKLIELLKEKRQAVISHAVTKGLDSNVPMKDSGVEWLGEVPEHWEIKQNKYLLEFVTSGSRGWAQYYADTGSLFFRIANLTRDTIEPKLESIQYVEPPKGSEGERSKIKINDLLISITADLGSVCVADASIKDGYVSQHVALCRPIKICVSRWLAYFILSDCAKEQFLGSGYGGTKIQLSLEDIKELIIAVPPRNEQLQISEYIDEKLTQYEHLICQAEKLIGTLQERRTALISAAVTGKIDVRNWQAPTVAEADTELSA